MKFFVSLLKRSFENKLLAGSFIMMVGSLITGFGNYLYHLLMGRMLGPVDYGVLASLISLVYLLSIPVGTLNLVIVKFVSTLKGQKRLGEVGVLFQVVNQRVLIISLLGFLVYLGFSPLLASFLHLNSVLPLVIVGIFSLIAVMTMINRAVLQGLLWFGYLSASNILEVVLKLGLAVLLVIWGYQVYGALFAFIVGGAVSYVFSLFPLKSLLAVSGEKKTFDGRQMVTFAVPVFLSTIAFTSLYTADIILVRHFLPAQQAGFYSALATLGKIIYFVSLPVILVLFPMVAERHANGRHYKPLLLASSGLVGLVCLTITGVYFLFPGLMVSILFGRDYLPAAPYLGLFGIYLSLYCFSFLLVNFYLSINKSRAVLLPVAAALLQIVLIAFFHQNLGQVIWISIVVTALLLISLLIYNFLREIVEASKAPKYNFDRIKK